MRFTVLIPALAMLPISAIAGVTESVERHIMPAVENFSQSAQSLSDTAAEDCTAEALRPAYQDIFDNWMGLSHLGFGPLEQDGRALTIEFWPDPRGIVSRTVSGLIAEADPIVGDTVGFADVSIAGRGLMALERLIYDPELSDYGPDDYSCHYVAAIATDLSMIADDIQADWQEHAKLLLSAGENGNNRYLSPEESSQTLYTALLSGLAFNADQRLGRPLGTFDRPRPTRAEAWRSGRPLRNITLSLKAMRDLAVTMSDTPIPATETAFETALATAEALDDPLLAGVEEPQSRLKIEILQQQIRTLNEAVQAEIGGGLGLSAGFNSRDGD